MPSFLAPLRHASATRLLLRNSRTGLTVADHLMPAFDSRSRNIGLLRHTSMPAMSAMIIAPTSAIHTFFMKFAIDVAFVAKDGRVVSVRSALRPWRMAWALGAYAVIELAEGALDRSQTTIGDELVVTAAESAQA
jgi:uncharacterized membrane protein (UPF0127 family)